MSKFTDSDVKFMFQCLSVVLAVCLLGIVDTAGSQLRQAKLTITNLKQEKFALQRKAEAAGVGKFTIVSNMVEFVWIDKLTIED